MLVPGENRFVFEVTFLSDATRDQRVRVWAGPPELAVEAQRFVSGSFAGPILLVLAGAAWATFRRGS